MKIRGSIEISGFKKMGLAIMIARMNDAMPSSVPPTNMRHFLPVTEIAAASGSVSAAGVKLPNSALKAKVSIIKKTKTSANSTPRRAMVFPLEFFIIASNQIYRVSAPYQ